MNKISLLDCTLRDGGYINNWKFGASTIHGFLRKIAQTGIEIVEVGFIKGNEKDPDRTMFPDVDSASEVIQPKVPGLLYVGMLDMSGPIPLDRIPPRNENGLDGFRVIFKKDKQDVGYEYCKAVLERGYWLCVNFVGTDLYSDSELIEAIQRFNVLHPDAMSIVDSFGVIKRKQFLRMVYLADHNMAEGITLAYHAHNNLQQAFGNAEALIDLNLRRNIMIDACIFGMGRGAGNLNMELLAEYMNENYDTHYKIKPMLEIMDEYLNEIYQRHSWGYSLPLYLSASLGCHPNYAVTLAEKDTLSVKAFSELLENIPPEDKASFSKEKAEFYYQQYMANYLNDKQVVEDLSFFFAGKTALLLAPGKSLKSHSEEILSKMEDRNTLTIAVNFTGEGFSPDYIFSSNMRRFKKIQGQTDTPCIVTSNVKEADSPDFVVNYSSYISKNPDITDNSGLMALRLLQTLGVKNVLIAGMDGYSAHGQADYINEFWEYDFGDGAELRNREISEELHNIHQQMPLTFITPTQYRIN